MKGLVRTFQIVRPMRTMTVLENAMIGAFARTAEVDQASEIASSSLTRVGLQNKAYALAGSLTLPDRKMLELARAIAARPRLLLLDEVMAGLRRSGERSDCRNHSRVESRRHDRSPDRAHHASGHGVGRSYNRSASRREARRREALRDWSRSEGDRELSREKGRSSHDRYTFGCPRPRGELRRSSRIERNQLQCAGQRASRLWSGQTALGRPRWCEPLRA